MLSSVATLRSALTHSHQAFTDYCVAHRHAATHITGNAVVRQDNGACDEEESFCWGSPHARDCCTGVCTVSRSRHRRGQPDRRAICWQSRRPDQQPSKDSRAPLHDAAIFARRRLCTGPAGRHSDLGDRVPMAWCQIRCRWAVYRSELAGPLVIPVGVVPRMAKRLRRASPLRTDFLQEQNGKRDEPSSRLTRSGLGGGPKPWPRLSRAACSASSPIRRSSRARASHRPVAACIRT